MKTVFVNAISLGMILRLPAGDFSATKLGKNFKKRKSIVLFKTFQSEPYFIFKGTMATLTYSIGMTKEQRIHG